MIIAIHGGAGTILKENLSVKDEKMYRETLASVLEAAYKALHSGATAVDAVEQAVTNLEDSPLFNAGKGSVLNHQGEFEMDASIMDGKRLEAGAVAAVKRVRNPIGLARKVMEYSEHVFLSGSGAEEFARKHNLVFEKRDYFLTELRKNQWERAKAENKVMLDHSAEKKFGTVGAVALDHMGNLAAATSTGGLTNKKYNRIGDSPVIGAGTYANNKTCAVSCTGDGEYFIKAVAAHSVSAIMELAHKNLMEAANIVVNEKLIGMGGEGGLIAVDKHGNLAMPFNSKGMYRGWKNANNSYVAIYEDN